MTTSVWTAVSVSLWKPVSCYDFGVKVTVLITLTEKWLRCLVTKRFQLWFLFCDGFSLIENYFLVSKCMLFLLPCAVSYRGPCILLITGDPPIGFVFLYVIRNANFHHCRARSVIPYGRRGELEKKKMILLSLNISLV